jgi:hypothetical protein
MGTEYILAAADKPAPGASMAEDVIGLQLLTAGDTTGPVDYAETKDPHDF